MKMVRISVLFFLLSTFNQVTLSTNSSSSRELIWDLISTMNIRQHGLILDNATIHSFTDHVYSKYTRNTFYRKFVHVFNIYLKPKLILLQEDTCDPSRNKYLYPENNLVTEESLAYWVATHIPGSSDPPGNYCDFRLGLVCNPHNKICECPKGSTYTSSDKTGVKSCFIDPDTECQLPDLDNSVHVKGLLLETLPDLIFNPERPLSCSPGTHCRFYPPYLDMARCWCHDLTIGKCSTAKVYWSLASAESTADEPVDISQVLELMWRSTFGFQVTHTTATKPPNGTLQAPSIATNVPVLHGLTELMESLGEEGFVNPSIVHHLEVLKKTLNASVNVHCWRDMNPDYVCTPKRKIVENFSNNYTITDYCECVQEPNSNTTMTTIDSKQWKLFGVECTLNEVIDSGGMCEPGTSCYRWDLNAPTGICYCPEGYGWQPCDKRTEQDKFSLTNFIHPTTTSARGEELQLIQFLLANLEQNQIYVGDATLNKSCDITINTKWKTLYDFLLSLERYPVIIKNGPDYPTLLAKLGDIPPDQETICDFKNGWECIQENCVQSGTKMSDTSHGQQVITTWTKAQRYVDDLEKQFDSVQVPTEDESDCHAETCSGQNICLEKFSSNNPTQPVQTEDCNRNKTESICQCLNLIGANDKKSGADFNTISTPCGRKQLTFDPCERYSLQTQIEALTYSLIQESVLDMGEKCDFWSEINILTAIKLLKRPPKDQPLYQIVGNLFKALSSPKQFCDRRKLLRCNGVLGKCECWRGTSLKWNDNGAGAIASKFCYAIQGACNKDPVLLSYTFPQEWVTIRGHYGDPSNPSHLDENSCLKNLCVQSSPGKCLDDPKYGRKWTTDHLIGENSASNKFRINLLFIFTIYVMQI